MKITGVKTYVVPQHVSSDDWCNGKAFVFVKVETDAGITGWGEAYAPHDRELSTAQLVHELARYVDGMDPFRIKYFTTMAYEQFAECQGGIDFFAAVSGIEIALWDIVGKALNVPVHKLLGGTCRNRINIYANCWSHEERSAEQLANYATQQVALGFKAIKIYPFLYTDDVNVGIARLRAVREALGDKIDILVDAWRVADIGNITKVSDALRQCGVEWFEDPIALDNIELLANIRQMARLPIVTGETICRKQDFRLLLEGRAADILNPDISCCGILEIKEIAAMAEPYFVKVAIHNYNSMAIGLGASLQVAAVIPNFARVEYFHRFVEASMQFSSHSFTVDDEGCIDLGNEPGLGVSIDETVLQNMNYSPAQSRPWPAEIRD
ncbi:MAG: mandelate racemase/muconate lactonizing enzyme family protein [Rhodospirillales bacterium]|nr:mandelate racemase/muconate lactonizing enzyme family protein [Rhodospirillales bacterium]